MEKTEYACLIKQKNTMLDKILSACKKLQDTRMEIARPYVIALQKKFPNKEDWSTDSAKIDTGNFWAGTGFIRLVTVDPVKEIATLEIYDTNLRILRSVTLQPGQITEPPLRFRGFTNPFFDTFRIKLNQISRATDKVLLEVVRDGKSTRHAISVGMSVYPGSSWRVKEILDPILLKDKNTGKLIQPTDNEPFLIDINDLTEDDKVLCLQQVIISDRAGNTKTIDKQFATAARNCGFKSKQQFRDVKVDNSVVDQVNSHNAQINLASNQYNVPISLIKAVMAVESSGVVDPEIGADGEVGLMQIIPKTAKGLVLKVPEEYIENKKLIINGVEYDKLHPI